MKYYQYISDAKVDMLLPQIPAGFKQKISVEAGFDIKVFAAKIKTETDALSDRVRRLDTVSKYIRETELIGSVEKPEAWIAGTYKAEYRSLWQEKIIGYFIETEEIRCLLAGSSVHVIGSAPEGETVGHAFSFSPRLMKSFERAVNFINDGTPEQSVAFLLGKDDTPEENWKTLIKYGPELGDRLARISVEFLAKRLLHIGEGKGSAVLATPLYVAMVD